MKASTNKKQEVAKASSMTSTPSLLSKSNGFMSILLQEKKSTKDILMLTEWEKSIDLNMILENKEVNRLQTMLKTSDKVVLKLIYALVERFNNLLNVSKPMNKEQMIILSYDLMEAFRYDTLEDVTLFFTMARKGTFGRIYRIDPVEIMGWIPLFLKKKAEEREEFKKREESQLMDRRRLSENKEICEFEKQAIEDIHKKYSKVRHNEAPLQYLTPEGIREAEVKGINTYEGLLKLLKRDCRRYTDYFKLRSLERKALRARHLDISKILDDRLSKLECPLE